MEKLAVIKKNFLFLSIFALLTFPGLVFSEDYPIRPITLLWPYEAGGTGDLISRSLAEIAKDILGQPVIVIDKPGGGVTAQSIVVKEKPDGYTIAATSQIAFTQIPQIRHVNYDPLNDFEYIMEYFSIVGGITCRSDKPWKSMKDLVAYSKQYPGRITAGNPGALGSSHIGAEIIAKKEGVKWQMVPFNGGLPAIAALLGGHVEIGTTESTPFKPHVKSGELRILAIEDGGEEQFPNVPTFKELGYNTVLGAKFGIVAPKGTPREIINKLHDAFKKAMKDPRYAATCEKLGIFGTYSSGDEFFRTVKSEYEARGKILRELGHIKGK